MSNQRIDKKIVPQKCGTLLFTTQNFRDWMSNHKIHENIVTKFGAIQYLLH